ncbi:MAG: response regulator transcription factor [Ignavibacteriaceae bacterium]
MEIVKIIIADDHPLFRTGVRVELERVPRFSIIEETGDGAEALDLIRKLNPDVAILDFQMPGLNGLEIASGLDETGSSTQIILLTMYGDKKIFYKALDLGVMGYVLKDDAVIDIVNAVDAAASGQHFISGSLTDLLVEKVRNKHGNNEIVNLINNLTSTEKKILALIGDLKLNEEIAEVMFISKKTVENHKVNIAGKLQLKGSRNLFKFAFQNKEYLQD